MTEDDKSQVMLMHRRGWSPAGIARELEEGIQQKSGATLPA